jgi:hypothetical protein
MQLPDGVTEWEDPVFWNRMHYVALCGKLALEEDTDSSKTDYAMHVY